MRWVSALLLWIDQSPVRYWLVALSAFAALLTCCLWPAVQACASHPRRHRCYRWLGSDALFLVLAGVVILAFRWPLLFIPKNLDADESSFLSQALTLRHDLVFWRSVMSGTSGPLNIYPLLLPWLLGLPINFLAARLIGLACVIGTVAFFYLTCRPFAPRLFARLAILPPVTFFALTTSRHFTHYSGEHVPILLLTMAFWLALELCRERTSYSRVAFATGCVLGAVPFAKVQGALIALTITIFGYLVLLTRRGDSWKVRLRNSGWLTLGGLTIPALLLSITAAFGAFKHFWQSYILANAQYGQTGLSLLASLKTAPILDVDAQAFFPYCKALLWLSAAGIGLGGMYHWRHLSWNAHLRFVALAIAVLAVSWFSVVIPGWPWPHYLLFLVIPTAAWAFATFAFWLEGTSGKSGNIALLIASLLWCGLGVGWQLLRFERIDDRHLGHLEQNLRTPRSIAAQTILKFASAEEPLAIWGWDYDLDVETQMGRATSDNYFDYMKVYGGSVPKYFQDLYISDLQRSKPPVFVDQFGGGMSGFGTRATAGYEHFPPLAKYIRENYVPVDENTDFRIFVRKDRLKTVLARPDSVPILSAPGKGFSQPGQVAGLINNSRTQANQTSQSDPAYALRFLGDERLIAGSTDTAIAILRKAVEANPDSDQAHTSLGNALMQKGQLDEAMAQFQKAQELQPDNALAHYNLGRALVLKRRLQEAVAHFAEVARITPELASVHYDWANALGLLNKFDEAIAHYAEAVKLQPDYAEPHFNWGNVLVLLGRLEEAKSHYLEALRINPAYAEAHCNLGNLFILQGKVDEAISQFMDALIINPQFAEGHYYLAGALARQRLTGEAVTHLRAALESKPDYAAAANELAWLLATESNGALRNAAEAVRWAERACELTANQAAGYLDTLGVAYSEAGRFKEAVEVTERAAARAMAAGDKAMAARMQSRLEHYRAGRPYHVNPEGPGP